MKPKRNRGGKPKGRKALPHKARTPSRAAPPRAPLESPIGALPISLLVEIMCAVHLSSYVQSPFQDRGGLMVVGPPSVLKSTLLGVLDHTYHDAVAVSDINARSLGDLRDQIAAKVIRTLVIPELSKIYKRHVYTAENVEGTLQALVAEGFNAPSFEDSRIARLRARVTLLAGLVPQLQVKRFKEWEDSGFNRRFLWSLVRLKDPALLERAVEDWRLIDFKIKHLPPAPPSDSIPNTTTRQERADLRRFVKYQPGGTHAIQIALLTKILAVLKWWYMALDRPPKAAMQSVRLFAQTLGKEGAELIV